MAPVLSWTSEQRLVLHLLHTCHPGLNREERTAVFNAVFQDEILACGFQDGIGSGLLESKYKERNLEDGKSEWAAVLRGPITIDDTRAYLQLQTRLATPVSNLNTTAHQPYGNNASAANAHPSNVYSGTYVPPSLHSAAVSTQQQPNPPPSPTGFTIAFPPFPILDLDGMEGELDYVFIRDPTLVDWEDDIDRLITGRRD